MSTNCIRCVVNKRTSFDLLCDECRIAEAKDRESRILLAPAHGSGALPWSEEKPKRRGWWWWKYDGSEEPLILPVNERLEVEHPYGWMTLDLMTQRFPGMRWAGPLPEPVELSLVGLLPNDEALRRAGKRVDGTQDEQPAVGKPQL